MKWWHIAAGAVAIVGIAVFSCIKMSGDCSREEEKRHGRK